MRPPVRPLLLLLLLLFTPFHAALLIWPGAITNTSITVHIQVPRGTTLITLSPDPTFSKDSQAQTPNANSTLIQPPLSLHRFTFRSLSPATLYHLALTTNATRTTHLSIPTYPTTAPALTIALSSCQLRPSWTQSFSRIVTHANTARAQNPTYPFLMLHMGDMTYSDIVDNDPALFQASLLEVLQQPQTQRLLSSLHLNYMYDDHDYGPNNSDFDSPSREAALANYRTLVPSYPLPSRNASYHAFTVASVRIILSDLRALARKEPGSTLATEQREWFFQELAQANRYDLVVWMSSKPWIGKSNEGGDSWAGFPAERRQVANAIKELNVTNLVVVAGDAHMLAYDDGSHADYADDGGGGFPVFQAAPLGNRGSSKGGPYSGGCFARRLWVNRQYALLKVSKLGDEAGPCVRFEGFVGNGERPVMEFAKCGVMGGVRGVGGEDDACAISVFPAWVWALIALGIVGLVGMIGAGIFFCCRSRRRRKEKGRAENIWVGPDSGDGVVADSAEDDGLQGGNNVRGRRNRE
eukprot:GFKZ01005296.1.p1 GENE.GFKZ01005296.1~~GFKZ01005296.1.p1  ORF type:complete len:524 (-),score=55.46 GFKZ01005296.1:587-2158(-)